MKTPTGFLLSSRPEQAALRSEESGRADPCQRTKVAHSLKLGYLPSRSMLPAD
jgi:hypothetical protein